MDVPRHDRSWALRIATGTLRIAGAGMPPSSNSAFGSYAVVLPYLAEWITNPLTRDMVLHMYEAAYGFSWPGPDTRDHSHLSALLRDALEAAFRSGRLVVIRPAGVEFE